MYVISIFFFFQKYNYTMNRRSLSQTTFNLLEHSKDYFNQKQIPACLFLTLLNYMYFDLVKNLKIIPSKNDLP